MNEQEKNTSKLEKNENTEYLNNPSTEDKQETPEAVKKPRKKTTVKKSDTGSSSETEKDKKQAPARKPRKKAADAADEAQVHKTPSLSKENTEIAEDVIVEEIPEQSVEICEEANTDIISEAESTEATVTDDSATTEAAPSESSEETIQNSDSIYGFDNDIDEVEIILPPDEIFAVPLKQKEEEPSEEPVAECIDEYGQYRFAAIAEEEEEEEDSVELDYSEPAQEKYNEKKPRKIDGKFDFIELFIFTFLAVIIVTSFLFRHSVVEGESMEKTLFGGEHLIISDLFYTPKRGDVIVCEDYTTALRKPIVKRVIGIEGDVIKITEFGNTCIVTVNGEVLDESAYINIDDSLTDLETNGKFEIREYKPITVGKDELFVMGDHRNMSTDSRIIGTVSEDSVLGKVILRFYPFNKFGAVN